LINKIQRIKIEFVDALRCSKTIRGIFRYLVTLKAFCTYNKTKRLINYVDAAHYSSNPNDDCFLNKRIHKLLDDHLPEFEDILRLYGKPSNTVLKSVILKPYISNTEPGILYISFDKLLARVLTAKNFSELAKKYILVFEPSYSSPHSLIFYVLPRLLSYPLFSTISNPKDKAYIKGISPNSQVLDIMAASWVDEDQFQPKANTVRDIDILIVGCFTKVKRHFALFKAIRNLPEHYKIAVIGETEGKRTLETIKHEAGIYGVEERIEFIGAVGYDEISDYLGRAKATAIFSKREGSCVIIAEALFADTPAGLYEDAEIGTRYFINKQTGVLFNDSNITESLIKLVEQRDSFTPRKWAIENGKSAIASHQYLNEKLKLWSLENGLQWSADIYPMKRCPNPVLIRENDIQQSQYEQETIFKEHNIWIGNKC